jgi:hypothetical protein
MTAESTCGGGWNAPGGTRASSSTRATAWTFTPRAPYSLPPGAAATRSATSRCTRYTARAGAGREGVEEDRRGDVVRHVAGEHEVGSRERGQLHLEHVGLDDRDVRRRRVAGAQVRREVAVDLDGHESAGARGEQIRERAPPRADLDDGLGAGEAERVGDAAEHLPVAEEVLAEALARAREPGLVDVVGHLSSAARAR